MRIGEREVEKRERGRRTRIGVEREIEKRERE